MGEKGLTFGEENRFFLRTGVQRMGVLVGLPSAERKGKKLGSYVLAKGHKNTVSEKAGRAEGGEVVRSYGVWSEKTGERGSVRKG